MHAATRPRLRYAAPLLRGGGELHVVGSQDVLTIDDPDGAIHRLVELADGSRSTSELYVALAPEYPRLHHQDVLDAVYALEAAGLFEYCEPRRGGAGERRARGELAAPPSR
jgi:hypothetical protein